MSSVCLNWDDFSIVFQYFCFSVSLSFHHTFCAGLLQYRTRMLLGKPFFACYINSLFHQGNQFSISSWYGFLYVCLTLECSWIITFLLIFDCFKLPCDPLWIMITFNMFFFNYHFICLTPVIFVTLFSIMSWHVPYQHLMVIMNGNKYFRLLKAVFCFHVKIISYIVGSVIAFKWTCVPVTPLRND